MSKDPAPRPSSRPTSGPPPLASFLSNIDEIKDLLAGGHSIHWIWSDMRDHGKTTYSYESFRRRVRRHIGKQSPVAQIQAVVGPISGQALLSAIRSRPSAEPLTTPTEPSFVFTRNPKKEDLI